MYAILDSNLGVISHHRSQSAAIKKATANADATITVPWFIRSPSGDLVALVYCGVLWWPKDEKVTLYK